MFLVGNSEILDVMLRKTELSVGDTHSHRYRVANIDNGRDSRSKKQK